MKKHYICTTCNEEFNRKSNAKRHLERVHDGGGGLAVVAGAKVNQKGKHPLPVSIEHQPSTVTATYYYDRIHPRQSWKNAHEGGVKSLSSLDPVEFAVKLGTIAENLEKWHRLKQFTSFTFPSTAYPSYNYAPVVQQPSTRMSNPADAPQSQSENSPGMTTVSGPGTSKDRPNETQQTVATVLPTGNFYVLQDLRPILPLDSHDRKYLYYLFLRLPYLCVCWRFEEELITANREGQALRGEVVKDGDVIRSLEARLDSEPIFPTIELSVIGEYIAHGKDVRVREPAPVVWDNGCFVLESITPDNIAITITADKLNGRYRLAKESEGVWLFSKQAAK